MTDYDSPWKEALERYFPAFLAFFFPEAHGDIAWARGYEFLDKELQQAVRDAELGRRLADKLVKVWRLDGHAAWVLIHLEIQGQYDAGFAERMFIYYYRLHDRHHRPLASFALLTDARPGWRPANHRQSLWACEAHFRFPSVKLLDYRHRLEELEQMANPFAVLTLSHLKAQDTAHDPEQRYLWKLRLIKSLYQRGYERADILELFRFIDWLLELPDGLEAQIWSELQSYEEHTAMPYVTSVERIGINKGLLQGRLEGRLEGRQEEAARLLRRQLVRRFGALPAEAEAQLAAAGLETLERWAEQILDAPSLDALFSSRAP